MLNKIHHIFVCNYLRMFYTHKRNHIYFKINRDYMQLYYVCNYIRIKNKKVLNFSINAETLYKRKHLRMVKVSCNFCSVVIDRNHYVSFL